jgi:hypothetical protein
MQQIIQLRPDDDILGIRARIESAELSRVILVVPRDCAVLQSERGVRMLRRAADDLGVYVAMVAHDEQVRERAELFGIPTFNSLAQAQRARWTMQPLEPDAVQRTLNPPPPESVSRAPLLSVERVREWWGVIAALIVASVVICFAALALVPAANVRIVPAAVALSLTTDVIADPSAQQVISSLRAVPARRITREVNGTAQLKTTTTRNLPDARATGSVIFTNLRAEETTVPMETIVKTSAGVPIRFTTVVTATVPAGINSRSPEIPIQAIDPGPGGNVKELAINQVEGSLALEVRVINTKPTISGNVKPVKIVTAEDKKKLEAQLAQQLQQQGAELLKKDLKPEEFLAPDSVVIDTDSATFDRAVDEPADALNLRMTATAFGLAVAHDDLNLLASALLQKQMPPGYLLLPNGVQAEPLPGGKFQGPALRMPIRAVGYTAPQIDTAQVARALQGKSADDARAYLSGAINLAQPAEINITPLGWRWMPWLSFRIAVFVEPPPVAKK